MSADVFTPNLSVLPPPQLQLWPELSSTPAHFTLYGGTALALRLGHRISVDFDFFTNEPFDPEELANAIPYLSGSERVQVAPNTLTCRIERSAGPVGLVSYFGNLGYGQAAQSVQPKGVAIHVASLLDIAGTKASAVQRRAETKDYLDIDALISHGIDLSSALAAAYIVFGPNFNALITLKALGYFDDVPTLHSEIRARLTAAIASVDLEKLPSIQPVRWNHPEP